jgi:hypothetical protein
MRRDTRNATPTQPGKILLFDDTVLIVSSQNLPIASLLENRELSPNLMWQTKPRFSPTNRISLNLEGKVVRRQLEASRSY